MADAKLLPRSRVAGVPIALPTHGSFRIGREAQCDLFLDDPGVSRSHAVIESAEGGWDLRDLGAGNGTFVDGRRVRSHRLRGGEVIRFGPNVEYRFVRERELPAWRGFLLSLLRWTLRSRDSELPDVMISGAPAIVGRGRSCTAVLSLPRISDLHARLERRGGRVWVLDTRSRNGTWVNGERIRERALRPGDEVAFADVPFDVVLTARPSRRGLVAGAAAGLAVAAAATLPGLWPGPSAEPLWTREMYVEHADRSLLEAVAALEQVPPAADVAEARFNIAIRSLQGADLLGPGERTETELAEVLRRAGSGLKAKLGGRDLYAAYASLGDARSRAPEEEEAFPEPEVDRDALVERELASILAEFGIDTAEQPVPPDLLAEVQRFVRFWADDRRSYTTQAMRRAEPYLAMIRREFRENRLPDVFSYLPFVESAYRADVSSPARARGLWQFMPATARKYGLTVDETVDERTDPTLATGAACSYVNDLLAAFGANAFMCAIAAYNKGEYGLVNCLRGVSWQSQWKFWDIVSREDGCLKRETVEYVPKVLAAAIVMRSPRLFGLDTDAPE